MVYVDQAEALPLGADEYFHYQIEGLVVRSETGEELGRVPRFWRLAPTTIRYRRQVRGALASSDQGCHTAHRYQCGNHDGSRSEAWLTSSAAGERHLERPKYWIGFQLVPGIGPVRLRALRLL